ncbi:MAG: TIGR00730 family Rossman fold protein [Clostridia bacterium]|nr:TIGR00730 family Rossman fold protein [Clostridia bacterium]
MNICVYGASSTTIDKSYIEAGEELGRAIGKRGYGLVFGGGNNGLMGAAARGVHETCMPIIGIAPSFFQVDGILYPNCTEFIYTETMRERKQLLEDKSCAFIISPGGIGTFDEFFEILTLKQLSRHTKPIAILNTNGYYNKLLDMLENSIDGGFLNREAKELYYVSESPEDILDYIESYNPNNEPVTKFKNIQ